MLLIIIYFNEGFMQLQIKIKLKILCILIEYQDLVKVLIQFFMLQYFIQMPQKFKHSLIGYFTKP